jgi:hypothetical protein
MYWSKKKNVEMMMMMGGDWPKEKLFHDQNMVVVDCANAKGEAQCDVLPKRCNMQYGETGQNKVIAHGGGDKDKIKMWVNEIIADDPSAN